MDLYSTYAGNETIVYWDNDSQHDLANNWTITNASELPSQHQFEEGAIFRYPLSWTILFVFAYSVVFIVGIVGNVMVVCALTMRSYLSSVTYLFILNLAVADLLVILFCIGPTLLANILLRKFSNKTSLVHCKTRSRSVC